MCMSSRLQAVIYYIGFPSKNELTSFAALYILIIDRHPCNKFMSFTYTDSGFIAMANSCGEEAHKCSSDTTNVNIHVVSVMSTLEINMMLT